LGPRCVAVTSRSCLLEYAQNMLMRRIAGAMVGVRGVLNASGTAARLDVGHVGVVVSFYMIVAMLVLITPNSAEAFRVIGSPGAWARWDAALRFVEGEERSLDGGLRYSIETGSYAGLRDQFNWVGAPPSEAAFEAAVHRAFEHWEVIDVASGLPAAFYFVEDLETPAIDEPGIPGVPSSYLGLNAGAEIDVFAATPHAGPAFGGSVVFFVDTVANDLSLTSGTSNYPGFAITGADIRINPAFSYTLWFFELLLTHEVGHALGLADLEANPSLGAVSGFLDDDASLSSDATAGATFSNEFVGLIDVIDPDASNLQSLLGDIDTVPGLDSPGVRLLMESGAYEVLRFDAQKLQNDEVAGRQFLYPVSVPEPGMGLMLTAGAVTLMGFRRLSR